MQRHRTELSRNQRIRMIYGNWDRMGQNKQQAILAHAEDCLANLESL
jgi:deoxyribodipyrimidine photolyase-related protein